MPSDPTTAKLWNDGKYESVTVCCAQFRHATEPGTDGEGYGAAIWSYRRPDGTWQYDLSSAGEMDYCPFCGNGLAQQRTAANEPTDA